MTQTEFPREDLDPDYDLPGLGPGTIVQTSEGEMPVEWLAPGDRIITRDHGAQPLLHVVRLRQTFEGRPLPMPMTFLPGEKAPLGELQDKLRVAPGQRGLLRRPELQTHFAREEALARFGDISRRGRNRPDPTMGNLTYHLLVMERHELILTGAFWVDSLGVDWAARMEIPEAVRAQTSILSPEAQAPRMLLTRDEAMLIRREAPADLSLLDLLAA